MSYRDWTINETIEKIGENYIYLPAIQRKFIWGHEQIESLFDSIMRGYPIGTFLFWFVSGEKKNEYTFYKFLDEYHERDSQNKKAAKPELKNEIIGVLDGQQRLSSMYLALQGWYSYKKPYARWDNDDAFPKRRFYLNLFKDFSSDEEDYLYEFKFLTNEESKEINEKKLWFLVSDVLTWGQDPDIDEYYEGLLENMDYSDNIKNVIISKRRSIKNKLRILHKRIVSERLINYFEIKEQDLDKILDIFVRVNSGGTVLSKSDLLFSTIVANWEEGREEIESFLKLINGKGEGFRFDTDFIMRSCLVLTDCPVLFKVNSFKKVNIEIIKKSWNNIKSSIEKMLDIIVEYGFSDETLTSYNALIPIVYHIIKGGKLNTNSKKQIRKYLIHAQIKQIYGGQGDTVLSRFRAQLTMNNNEHVLKNVNFSFNEILKTNLPGERTLKIDENTIEDILELRKGPYTFMIMSLLYPQLKFNQVKFHQDHIHPASLFTDSKLRKINISKEQREEWKYKKDRLPNLQIMEGRENESKNNTPFKDWLYGVGEDGNPNVIDKQKYIKDNYIPNVNFELNNFEEFYESRKNNLRIAIKNTILQ